MVLHKYLSRRGTATVIARLGRYVRRFYYAYFPLTAIAIQCSGCGDRNICTPLLVETTPVPRAPPIGQSICPLTIQIYRCRGTFCSLWVALPSVNLRSASIPHREATRDATPCHSEHRLVPRMATLLTRQGSCPQSAPSPGLHRALAT